MYEKHVIIHYIDCTQLYYVKLLSNIDDDAFQYDDNLRIKSNYEIN